MPELAQAADGLHPAEDLFHEFSFPLTHVSTRISGILAWEARTLHCLH